MTNANGSSFKNTDLTITPIPYRHATDLIPSPSKPFKRYEPFTLKLGVVIGVPLLILALGVGLEIVIVISSLTDGFKVPQSNIFNVFGNVTPQFLASFFPTLVVLPAAIAWRTLDWDLRRYQPYLVLDKGNARAEESLLLDYINLGRLTAEFIPRIEPQASRHLLVVFDSYFDLPLSTAWYVPYSRSSITHKQAVSWFPT
ncbi:hypothetical protein BYT27DRAFT_7251401 [Phlegmacium glaucopus]|nr:hypothetical protein BYT27DRAFT_7251401 [Phlegmacium glaucopus]